MFIGSPPLKLSPNTDQDSDGNAMLKDHAYLAQSDGYVNGFVGSVNVNEMRLFVGSTSDPAGAGTRLDNHQGTNNDIENTCSLIAKGEYFEFTMTVSTPTIFWRSFGPLKKPVDYN